MGGMRPAGQDGTGLGASVAAAAAKVEGREASAPSQCSAGSSGEASGADPLQQRGQSSDGKAPVGNSSGSAGMISSALVAAEGQEAVTAASFPSQASASVEGSFDGTGVTPARGGGIDTAALTGASLLAAAAAAVAVNNRARGGGHGGEAIPFDDPEKWPSVITVRQILAQPMAEWQPVFTRQRVSIKVSPCTCMDWIIYSFCLVVVEGVCSALTCLGGLTMPFFSTLSADPRV